MGSCSATALYRRLLPRERVCYICGRHLDLPCFGASTELTREHVIPKSTGIIFSNGIVPACLECNSLKASVVPTPSYLAALGFKVKLYLTGLTAGEVYPVNYEETVFEITDGTRKCFVLLKLRMDSSAAYCYFSITPTPKENTVDGLHTILTNLVNQCGWIKVPENVRDEIRYLYSKKSKKSKFKENPLFSSEQEMREVFSRGSTYMIELHDTTLRAAGASTVPILEPKNPQHSVVSPEPTVVSPEPTVVPSEPIVEVANPVCNPLNHPIPVVSTEPIMAVEPIPIVSTEPDVVSQEPAVVSPEPVMGPTFRTAPDPSVLSGLQGPPEPPRTKSLSEAEELDQIVMSFAVDFAKTLTKFFKEKEVHNPVDALTESIARLSNQPACCVYGERDNQFVLPGF